MDMTGFDSPGSETVSIKSEDKGDLLNQEVGGRWRGIEQLNAWGKRFYNENID